MKTLSKLGKGRYSAPILNCVLVQNGIALTSDIDQWIMQAVNVPDGLYSAHGFAEGILTAVTDRTVVDFPTDTGIGKESGRINIPAAFVLDQFAWVAKAQSTEWVRYYLNGICFHGNRVIATDGHRLHMASIAAPWPISDTWSRGMIMPRESVKYLLDLVKEHKPEIVTFVFYENGFEFILDDKATLICKNVDGTYPDYERVIPRHEKTTAFKVKEIQSAMKEAKILAKAQREQLNGVKIADGTITAYGKTWPVSCKLDGVEIGFNLALLADTCDGQMQYGDSAAPVLIAAPDRQAVVMPMRI